MKKAVVIGGSNGIGLAISKKLYADGYQVNVLDICPPDACVDANSYSYEYCNLRELDTDLVASYAKDKNVELVMITAGLGRVTAFENLCPTEIEKLLTINLTATLKILRIFYPRLMEKTPFYCGVMGSIAGLVSSPLFSVYAASKAGICRFTESVNIELEMMGSPNRILNVSPGSIKGTKFNGGANDLSATETLASEILEKMQNRETLYIPDYDTVFKRVLDDYATDAHAYGVHSYQYKTNGGRVQSGKGIKIGYLSGTFDLFHVGHLNLLRRAKAQCDYLVVGVHDSGAWKGKETFIPFEERVQIVGACKYVDKVVQSCREDCDAWDLWHYDKLFVGSDYKGTERFNRYEEYFKDKGVEIVYFPYTKGTSSTQLREKISSGKKE